MAKSCLIYEALNDVSGMSVHHNDEGLMTLSGVFGVCGVRNNNQRVYETSNYSKMVSEMKERIVKDGAIPGELEHPQVMNITLENISHKITDINIDENGLVTGTIALLNTPKGKLAQELVRGGLPLFISSRATGAVDSRTGNVTLEKIATYDLVGSPGFSQARLNLNESQMADFERTMESEGLVEMNNNIYTQISESNVYYVTEKENQNENDNMELKEILEKIEALEARIEELKSENSDLRESLNDSIISEEVLEKIAKGVQNWVINEYSPKIQEWVIEHYTPANNASVIEEAIDNANDLIDEAVEDTKNWVINDMTPVIETWCATEFAPVLEKWCITEFASGIQKWVNEEYTGSVDVWLNESFTAKLHEKMQSMIAESKTTNLDAIGETLTLLESLDATKPTYSRKALITENADEPKFIQEMPADARVKWDLASDEVKESIKRRAKLYNFVSEGSIDRFWAGVNFETVKPVQNIYEGLEKIEDEREREIRAKLRSSRFRRI
jgi:hypothetical protein